MAAKWKYKVIVQQVAAMPDLAEAESALNALGAEGWILVSVAMAPNRHVYYLQQQDTGPNDW